MTTALYCVLAAGLMPFLWTGVAKVRGPRYNNINVRLWQSKLEGAAQRAHAAHLNSFACASIYRLALGLRHSVSGKSCQFAKLGVDGSTGLHHHDFCRWALAREGSSR